MLSAQAILGTLAESAARALVLGAIVAGVLAVCRPKNVRVKLLVWRALLCAALAMPVLVWLGPTVAISVPLPHIAERSSAAVVVPAPVPVAPSESATFVAPSRSDDGVEIAHRDDAPARLVPAQDASLGVSRAVWSSVPAPPTVRRPISRAIPWMLIALAVYAAIALALLVRVLIGIAFGSRLVRASTPVEDSAALDLLAAAACASGLSECPQLAESEMISVPVMIGVRKPTILIPADDREWDEEELAAVLLHEASHVARHDALLQRLALIHRAIFWFSPLSWWLERHLGDLSEQASDEAALSGGVDRTRYAESLLGFFADLEAVPERIWWQGVSMAKTGQAEKRVDRILSWRGAMSNSAASGWRKYLAVGLVAVGVPVLALTAAVRVSAYDIQAPPAPATPPAPAAPPSAATAPDPAEAATAPEAPAMASAAAQGESDSGDIEVMAPPAPPAMPEMRMVIPPVNVNVPAMHVVVPPVNINVPPVHLAIPQVHVETHFYRTQNGSSDAPMILTTDGDWNFSRGWGNGYIVGRYDDWSPRFAIVTKDSGALTMSGDREDAEHARALKQKFSGDFIWFRHDDKNYVVSDPATVDRAKKLWEPDVDLEKQQKDLARQQEALGKQQEEAAKKMEDAKIQVPDLSGEMQKLEEAMKKLSANGGTMSELGDLQSEIGEMQRRIGELQSNAGRQQGAWGREQGEWGRKMGELGRQQGQLGRRQAQEAREAARQMQQLLNDAVSKGLAKPE
jgi:beta-lactamase regulating signal transducer with metallopeptidase domain